MLVNVVSAVIMPFAASFDMSYHTTVFAEAETTIAAIVPNRMHFKV